MRNGLTRTIGLLWPAIAFAGFTWALIDGRFDFGGGEKDLVLVLPAALFVLFYWISFIWLWRRGKASLSATLWSAVIAVGLLIGIVIIGILFSLLGSDFLGLGFRL